MSTSESTCWTVIRAAAAGSPAGRDEMGRRYLGVVRAYLAARWRGSPLRTDLDDAACHAALAAAGQGEDAARLDDRERTRLRKQALDWLKADLALCTRQLDSDMPAERAVVQRALRHWQKDSDLASLRDKAALANLSAEERVAYDRLWAEVAELLKSARPSNK